MTTNAPHTLLCFAHRGASGYAPENTLESFEKAIQLGAPWVEFDVRVVEGTPIIFHDHSLTRMTDKRGAVEAQTLASISEITVRGHWKIPHLSETLDLLKGRAGAQIELKGPGSGLATAHTLSSHLKLGWDPAKLLVSSFLEDELLAFHNVLPTVPLGVLGRELSAQLISLAAQVKAYSLHLKYSTLNQTCVTTVHQAGYKLFAYTVNELKDLKAMHRIGVDGVFCDFPDRVLSGAYLNE